jgi:hypothetical protein
MTGTPEEKREERREKREERRENKTGSVFKSTQKSRVQ